MLSFVNNDTLVILVTVFAVLISKNLNNDLLNILGNIFTQLGASLLTKAALQQSLTS